MFFFVCEVMQDSICCTGVEVFCIVLLWVAVCCSVLQGVAECCRVLQCVAAMSAS